MDDKCNPQVEPERAEEVSVYVDPTGLGLDHYYDRRLTPPWKEDSMLVFYHQDLRDIALQAGLGLIGSGPDTDTNQAIREAVLRLLYMDRELMANRPGVIPRSRVPAGAHIYTEPPP